MNKIYNSTNLINKENLKKIERLYEFKCVKDVLLYHEFIYFL